MVQKPLDLLKKHWGFNQFRPYQEKIIQSVLEGKDTLAILPTGGGKSVCFQIPGLMLDGITLVISPLIALMKDQTEQLKNKGISAIALHSGLALKERKTAYNNMVNEKYKFIYISPERLYNEDFRGYLNNLNIQLLVIDEAHCISQWGYDFRPSYTKITESYDLLPYARKIALTASAIPSVIVDLKDKLLFTKSNLFKASFIRDNLSYSVLNETKPRERLLNLVNKIEGSGLVFANSRRKTIEISNFLNKHNHNATYFHAGLSNEEKNLKQDAWIKGKQRIMVCTNAFGMGIDKADVRFVVHLHIPESLESYYQEAGRAGRDGEKAYCSMIINISKETNNLNDAYDKYPKKEVFNHIYQLMSTYLSIAYGSGINSIHDFDIRNFIKINKLSAIQTYTSLKLLDIIGLIHLSEGIYMPSRLHILLNESAYNYFMESNSKYEPIMSILLRIYGGIFDYHTKIDEDKIGKNISMSKRKVIELLKELNTKKVIEYLPREDSPRITFLENRLESIDLAAKKINFLRKRYTERLLSVLNYIKNSSQCRNANLAHYFGESTHKTCGICDNCLRNILDKPSLKKWENIFKPLIIAEKISPQKLTEQFGGITREQSRYALSQLEEERIISTDRNGYLIWEKK